MNIFNKLRARLGALLSRQLFGRLFRASHLGPLERVFARTAAQKSPVTAETERNTAHISESGISMDVVVSVIPPPPGLVRLREVITQPNRDP